MADGGNNDGAQSKEQPIIIKKIKKGGHGHHGGAWKVAYADFVTAMMAFFIVMWILASTAEVKENVQAYFEDPFAYDMWTGRPKGERPIDIDLGLKPVPKKGDGEGNNDGDKIFSFEIDTSDANALIEQLKLQAREDSVAAAKRIEQVGKELMEELQQLSYKKPEFEEILSSIKIEMTQEGLRIELIETSESLFFEVGSDKLKPEAVDILKQLSKEIGKLPNQVDIEGHTDSRGFAKGASYDNWNLSTDRAISARSVLANNGMWDGQIVKVTGFADNKLRNPDNPFDVSNRRVSILVRQLSAKDFLNNLDEF